MYIAGATRSTVLDVRASVATQQTHISGATPWGPGDFRPWPCCGSFMLRRLHHYRRALPGTKITTVAAARDYEIGSIQSPDQADLPCLFFISEFFCRFRPAGASPFSLLAQRKGTKRKGTSRSWPASRVPCAPHENRRSQNSRSRYARLRSNRARASPGFRCGARPGPTGKLPPVYLKVKKDL